MRPEKTAIVDDVKKQLCDSDYAVIVKYQGLNVRQLMALRQQLSESNASLLVAKNTFIRVALRELDKPQLDESLQGSSAVVAGTGDITLLLKKLLAFARENTALEVKGGILGRDALSAADVEIMSKMPPRKAMLGSLVGTIAAPMSGLVGVMSQKLLSLVYVLKAVEDKKSNE